MRILTFNHFMKNLGQDFEKNLHANAGDAGLIPWLGRSPGEEKGNPILHSCLGNPMNRGALWATVLGVVKESYMTYLLNNNNIKKTFLLFLSLHPRIQKFETLCLNDEQKTRLFNKKVDCMEYSQSAILIHSPFFSTLPCAPEG